MTQVFQSGFANKLHILSTLVQILKLEAAIFTVHLCVSDSLKSDVLLEHLSERTKVKLSFVCSDTKE
jgi:hypothetical protein